MFKNFYKMHKKLFWIVIAVCIVVTLLPILVTYLPDLYSINRCSDDFHSEDYCLNDSTYNDIYIFSRIFISYLGFVSGLFIAATLFLFCVIKYNKKYITNEYMEKEQLKKLQKKQEKLNKELNEVNDQINKM